MESAVITYVQGSGLEGDKTDCDRCVYFGYDGNFPDCTIRHTDKYLLGDKVERVEPSFFQIYEWSTGIKVIKNPKCKSYSEKVSKLRPKI